MLIQSNKLSQQVVISKTLILLNRVRFVIRCNLGKLRLWYRNRLKAHDSHTRIYKEIIHGSPTDKPAVLGFVGGDANQVKKSFYHVMSQKWGFQNVNFLQHSE